MAPTETHRKGGREKHSHPRGDQRTNSTRCRPSWRDPNPTPIERLLAERASLCWFIVNRYENAYANAKRMDASLKRISNIARSTKLMLDSSRRSGRWLKSASWRCQPSKSTSPGIKSTWRRPDHERTGDRPRLPTNSGPSTSLAGAESDGAGLADCESEAVAGWSGDDPEFIAALNRAKSYRTERLRADVRSLASDAMATLRELVSGPDVAPSVRLRASLAILQAANALKAEDAGPKTAEGVQAKIAHERLLNRLGGDRFVGATDWLTANGRAHKIRYKIRNVAARILTNSQSDRQAAWNRPHRIAGSRRLIDRNSLKSHPGGYTDPIQQTSALRSQEAGMTDQAKPVSRPWRRFLRFSVRGMIVLVIVIAGCLGWIARSARNQRQAIAAIIKMNGEVAYVDNSRTYPAPRNLIGHWLGINEVFSGVSVRLTLKEGMDQDLALARVGDLTNLQSLSFVGGPIQDSAIEKIGRANNLKWLRIQSAPLTRVGFRHLAQYKNLEYLFLYDIEIPEGALEHFGALASLKTLEMHQCWRVDKGFAEMQAPPRLATLRIRYAPLSDTGLKHIVRLPNLTELSLEDVRVTDAGMASLQGLSQLTELRLKSDDLTDAALACLVSLHTIRRLSIDVPRITDAGAEHLAQLTNLESLKFTRERLTDAGIMKLKPLKKLALLNIGRTGITEDGASELQKELPKLVEITRGTRVSSVPRLPRAKTAGR